MFDMMKMLGKMKEIQSKMKETQESLAKVTVSAESGAGLVKATVNGKKQVVSLDIDSSLLKQEELTILKDLLIAAINKALEEMDVKAKEEMKKNTAGLLPNIPGLDLSNLF